MSSSNQNRRTPGDSTAMENRVTTHALLNFSIVIPAYHEEGNLRRLYDELIHALETVEEDWEILFVDDGSADGTWSEICALHQMDGRVRGVRLSRNFGHQYAIFAGITHAHGHAVITMDADLQHPPAVIQQLLQAWRQGYKIVHTVRIDQESISLLKKFSSAIFYKVFSFLSGVDISAGMADFRLLDRQVVEQLLQFKEGGLFLRGLVHWVGYPSTNVHFQCRDRFSGKSKYSFRKMLKFAWTGITSFSIIPLRIGVIFGLVTSLFAFYQLIEALWTKFFTNRTVPGWTSLIGVMTLLFGVLFILIGLLGEYIGRILVEVRGRPKFIISEQVGVARNTDHGAAHSLRQTGTGWAGHEQPATKNSGPLS